MVLGAGGSARAVVWGLTRAGVRDVAVWNRTAPERAQVARRRARRTARWQALRRPTAGQLHACRARWAPGARRQRPDGGCRARTGGQCRGASNIRRNRTVGQGDRGAQPTCAHARSLREYSNVVDLVYRTGGTPLLKAAHRLGSRRRSTAARSSSGRERSASSSGRGPRRRSRPCGRPRSRLASPEARR